MQTLLHGWHSAVQEFSPLDWVIALAVLSSTLAAFARGFIRSLVSLAGLLFGIFVAGIYASALSTLLRQRLRLSNVPHFAAFVLLLAVTYFLITLLGRLLRSATYALGLSFVDRLAGAAFGFVRGVVLLAILAVPAAFYLQHFTGARPSVLLPYLLDAAHGISFVVPRDLADHLPTDLWPREHERAAKRSEENEHQKSRGEYE